MSVGVTTDQKQTNFGSKSGKKLEKSNNSINH